MPAFWFCLNHITSKHYWTYKHNFTIAAVFHIFFIRHFGSLFLWLLFVPLCLLYTKYFLVATTQPCLTLFLCCVHFHVTDGRKTVFLHFLLLLSESHWVGKGWRTLPIDCSEKQLRPLQPLLMYEREGKKSQIIASLCVF